MSKRDLLADFTAIDASLIELDNVFPFTRKSDRSRIARDRLNDLAWQIEDVRSKVLGEPKQTRPPL